MTIRRRNALSINEALELGEASIHPWGREKLKRLDPTLNCNPCGYSGNQLITVFDEAPITKGSKRMHEQADIFSQSERQLLDQQLHLKWTTEM
jgi:hypothetical protein